MKTIKDFIIYLGEIDKLAKKLAPEKKDELDTILRSLLTLLVCMRRDSHLGEIQIDFHQHED